LCTFIRSLRKALVLGNSNQLGLDRMDNLVKDHSYPAASSIRTNSA